MWSIGKSFPEYAYHIHAVNVAKITQYFNSSLECLLSTGLNLFKVSVFLLLHPQKLPGLV